MVNESLSESEGRQQVCGREERGLGARRPGSGVELSVDIVDGVTPVLAL